VYVPGVQRKTKRKTKTREAKSVPARLWRVPVYLPYLQAALTDRAVRQAEVKLGVKLPSAYLEALRQQNGGYLRLDSHPSDLAPVSWIAGIGSRFPSILRHDWSDVRQYMEEEGISTPERIEDLVPFCGDGHYHYCFDYRKSGRHREPRITYVDVETFGVDRVLAPDFGAFLRQLQPGERDEIYGVMTDARAAQVASALSRTTGLRFEDQGDQNHGYREYRAQLPGKSGWAWLSANRTRRGFVRKTDPEYVRLSKLLPETVDRYPQHSDCGYFLSCSDFDGKAGKALRRSLGKLPFPTRALRLD
jgi:SMI1 / KNR4 family (SUKH-1)